MKKYLCLIVLMLFVSHAFSQSINFQLKWSDKNFVTTNFDGRKYPAKQWSDRTAVVAADKEGLFVLHREFNTLFLERYDNNLELAQSIIYVLPQLKLNRIRDNDIIYTADNSLYVYNNAKVVYFNQQLSLIISVRNIKTGELSFFQQEIDKTTLQFVNEPLSIGSVGSGFMDQNFDYKVSEDSTKLLILSDKYGDRQQKKRFSLRVCDDNWKLLWDRDIELPYQGNLVKIEKYIVDKQGNAYVLAKKFNKRERDKYKGIPNYNYILFHFKNNGFEYDEYDLKYADKFISSIDLKVNDGGEVICAGLFSNKNATRTHGTCYFRINTQKRKIVSKKLESLNKLFFRSQDKFQKSSKQKDLYNIELDHLILRSDGGVLLLAEYGYQNPTSSGVYYHYHDIFAVNLNPSGTIDWATKIPKRQVDKIGFFSSYNVSVIKDKIYLFFNDHRKNLVRDTDKKAKKYTYSSYFSVATVAILSSDGKLERQPLYDTTQNIIPAPMVSRQINKNTILIYGEDVTNTTFQLGRLSFE